MLDYIILTKLDKTVLNTIFQVIKGSYKHPKFLVKQKSNKRLYLFYKPGIIKKNIPIIKKKYLAQPGNKQTAIKVQTRDIVYIWQDTYININSNYNKLF